MLPAAYQVPAAAVLLAGGAVACFYGYRLFKVVLGVFGFIIGALAASSVFGAADTTPMVIAAIVGGIAGASLLLAAYFVGVALVGAALGGAWTMLVGGLAIMGNNGPLKAAAAGDVWVAYPLNPAPGMRWLPWAWVILGAFGTLIQMRWTGGERGRVGKKPNRKKAAKEE